MFDTNKIYTDPSGKLFLCKCISHSEKAAEYIVATFIVPVRMAFPLAELYNKGQTVILETPDKDKTLELALFLNNSIKNMK